MSYYVEFTGGDRDGKKVNYMSSMQATSAAIKHCKKDRENVAVVGYTHIPGVNPRVNARDAERACRQVRLYTNEDNDMVSVVEEVWKR